MLKNYEGFADYALQLNHEREKEKQMNRIKRMSKKEPDKEFKKLLVQARIDGGLKMKTEQILEKIDCSWVEFVENSCLDLIDSYIEEDHFRQEEAKKSIEKAERRSRSPKSTLLSVPKNAK